MNSLKYKGVTYKVGDLVKVEDGVVEQISDIFIADCKAKEWFKTANGYEIPFAAIEWKISDIFFKLLPDNFTGTVQVINGRISKPQILNEEEKRYLEGVIRPFRDEVRFIEKEKLGDAERIFISLNFCSVELPYFEKGTMYKGMEADKKYSLKELGLFEEE